MDKESIFYIDSTTKDPKKTGIYIQNEKIPQSSSFTNTRNKINKEKQKAIRVQDTDINLPGVIKFNETENKFQGYVGGSMGDNNDGWVSFSNAQGINGTNGKDSLKILLKLKSFPIAVSAEVSVVSANAGNAALFFFNRTVNSVLMCCASLALPPFPQTIIF